MVARIAEIAFLAAAMLGPAIATVLHSLPLAH
jgi:hypothetical protein